MVVSNVSTFVAEAREQWELGNSRLADLLNAFAKVYGWKPMLDYDGADASTRLETCRERYISALQSIRTIRPDLLPHIRKDGMPWQFFPDTHYLGSWEANLDGEVAMFFEYVLSLLITNDEQWQTLVVAVFTSHTTKMREFFGDLERATGDSEGRNVAAATSQKDSRDKPQWNSETGKLSYCAQIIRTIKNLGIAKNIVRVLNAFEEEKWPDRIDDPIPPREGTSPIHETVKSLNNGLTAIRFEADGTGKGIRWRVLSPTAP